MRRSTIPLTTLAWWSTLFLILWAASWLRSTSLRNDLPTNKDPDEPYYFLWANAVKETGYPNAENGAGYPPGVLYLLAAEQITTDILRGGNVIPAIDYFVIGRMVSGLFGVLSVASTANLGRIISHSRTVGIICALFAALSTLMVQESRRANASAPWLFFTLLTFLFLWQSQKTHRLIFLYAALLSSVVSFLFKYQTLVILALPFLYLLVTLRFSPKKIFLHLAVWSIGLSLFTAWLVFGYKILSVTNTPNSPTGTAIKNGALIGFQSANVNWNILLRTSGGEAYLWSAAFVIVLAVAAFRIKSLNYLIDRGLILSTALFCILFYLLMSLFAPYSKWESYWLPVISGIHILAFSGAWIGLRLISTGIMRSIYPKWELISVIAPTLLFTVFGLSAAQKQILAWRDVYIYDWTRTYTFKSLDDWFLQNVPQGARVISKHVKLPLNYVYAPNIFHSNSVQNVFTTTVEDYRNNGYEYLIWNSMGPGIPNTLGELDSEANKSHLGDLQEMLRVTGQEAWGPDVVIYKIKSLPKHPLYLWFTPAISFRGYDLNKESFKPGDDLELMFYWMSAERVKANYIVFVHITSVETGELLVGKDEPTDNGYHPTWTWGGDMQFIRDRHTLTIPATAKAGSYIVRFGMYDADTKARVQIFTPKNEPVGDVVALQEIRIEK